jgi:ABC-2 type transport system ATP-binding protein
MIVAENLSKTFGDVEAVKNISFSVDKGEILGFLGPNGAGKTTAMRMLTCYFPPTTGTATVAGFDILKESLQVRREVGYMPENVPLYHDMPVENYLDFVASCKNVPGRERRKRVQAVMDECSLNEVADFPIGKISRGYKQRVGLAQAIVAQPKVLILDEPTVGLDPRQIVEIRELIKKLAEKSTVILSSHILPEVQMLCNRIIIINKGTIKAIDTPENLTAQLQQNTRIDLVIEGGEPSRIADDLGRVDGVVKVEVGKPAAKGMHFAVEASRSTDVRRSLAARIVKADLGLLEMRQNDMTLEDIFMQIVSNESSEDEQAPPSSSNDDNGKNDSKTQKQEAGV